MSRSRKHKTKNKNNEKRSILAALNEETKHGVLSIIFLLLAVFFALAAFDMAGKAGTVTYDAFETVFGYGYILVPIVLLMLSGIFLREERPYFALPTGLGALFFVLAALGLTSLAGEDGGGMIGTFIADPLVALFDPILTAIIFVGIIAIALLVMFDTRPSVETLRRYIPTALFTRLFPAYRTSSAEEETVSVHTLEDEEPEGGYEDEEALPASEADDIEAPSAKEPEPPITGLEEKKERSQKKKDGEAIVGAMPSTSHAPYSPPPLSLLENEKGKPGSGDIKANANVIKRTLQNFGVDVEMDEVSVGPSVTRYALKPAEGVRLSRIVSLQRDLELALAASPVRIEAPIPGKSLVGIELPNTTRLTVSLKSMLASEEYEQSDRPLLMALGRGVSGKLHFADLAKMPHLLIAGATGSGKSVAIHTMISSLLYRNSPESLRFIMVDPKRVELTLYQDIPHLLTPVITDPKKAIVALKWAAKEMDRRYDVLEAEKVRDISSYHKNVLQPALDNAQDASEEENDELPERMPYIVIVIDELADIMATYPRELESAIVRLAQMSRAVGIHLVLSTQRPSVNVITGLIKANIPARVALQVASQVDSRTILDAGGAEKLLGAGDMLYLSGEMAKPQRIQSAFISEHELKKVTKHLARQKSEDEWEHIELADGSNNGALSETALDVDDDEEEDPLFEQAREVVIASQKASTSFLQRRLKIGYSRAARLIDTLEERSVVGPQESSSKPRPVLEKPPEHTNEASQGEQPENASSSNN